MKRGPEREKTALRPDDVQVDTGNLAGLPRRDSMAETLQQAPSRYGESLLTLKTTQIYECLYKVSPCGRCFVKENVTKFKVVP